MHIINIELAVWVRSLIILALLRRGSRRRRNELDKKEGTGTLKFNGKVYNCGGRVGFNYPKDSIIDGYKEECHYSREYNVPMYYSVLWYGNKGVYIHEWGQLEGSAGCIHLLAPHAKEFYDSINGKARVLFKWI